MKKNNYEAPEMLAGVFTAEAGFATSGYGEANHAGTALDEDPKYTYDL